MMWIRRPLALVRQRLLAARLRSRERAEGLLVILLAALGTLHAEWRIVRNSSVFQTDAQIHEFWMRRFQDGDLFNDPITNALLDTGYSPPLFRALYWVASHLVDPVLFGELLPLALQPLCAWMVFRIVRDHVTWWPAAWLGALLFLVPWEIHRFSGGHPRAFMHPVVLLAVLLLMRRRHLAAALVPPVGLLLYPPAGLTALAIVLLAALERRRPFVNRERVLWAAGSVLGFAAAALATRFLLGSSEGLISEAAARHFPEFGPRGQMHFFATSTLQYLKQNYSGFALEDSGSILAIAAVFFLVVRPRNATHLRWEVWCLPIAALVLFTAAHLLLFRLYLPHRYTYPLIPFFCIVIAVSLRPTLESWVTRSRALLVAAFALPFLVAGLALMAFPLGPQLSASQLASWFREERSFLVAGLVLGALAAGVLWWRGRATDATGALAVAAAAFAGLMLAAEVTAAGGGKSPSAAPCRGAVYSYLGTLPKDAVIAGDPADLSCVPIAARRPVVISRKLYQPWDVEYFAMIRERMFSLIRAYYGPSTAALVDLRTKYGADYLLVRTPLRERPLRRMAPFTEEVRRLLRADHVPAALRLPPACRTWDDRRFQVYSLECAAREAGG
jgi:hypothetical protein